jgi:GxxExxY protein
MDIETINERTGIIVDAAMRVHTELGPGLLESAYQACLAYELRDRGLGVQKELRQPINYRGLELEEAYRLDLLVEQEIIVETKTVAKFIPIHEAQLLSYLKLSNRRVGLLINFHALHLRYGIKRMVNGL